MDRLSYMKRSGIKLKEAIWGERGYILTALLPVIVAAEVINADPGKAVLTHMETSPLRAHRVFRYDVQLESACDFGGDYVPCEPASCLHFLESAAVCEVVSGSRAVVPYSLTSRM